VLFFTDITTAASKYCLLNVNRLADPRKYAKKIIFVDPGVYELTKAVEYSQLDTLHRIAKDQSQFVSIDYPCDMNPLYTDEFIEKSVKNNIHYKDNPYYICTVQFALHSVASFEREFAYLHEQVDFTQKVVGIGNLCRIMRPCHFTDRVFKLLYKYKWYHYHFYGLALSLIKRYLPGLPHCSVDSTKWTRAVHNTLKRKNGVCARKHNRDAYFLAYIQTIKNAGITVDY